jgi:Ca-activated chloride channel family protein
MNIEIDPYAVLGVDQNATSEEIKRAYRQAARRLHPDVNQHNPGAAAQFQDVTVAYELLIDPEKRSQYDTKARLLYPEDRLVFTLRTIANKRAVAPIDEPQIIFLLSEIIPDPRAEVMQNVDMRLNLTLVLDRSKSMSDARMDKVKIAAHQIIDQLKPDDILSVVSFNDTAEVVIPATTITMTDKSSMKARISMIHPSGGTEIFHGLSAGIAQNRTYMAPRLVNHVILITDGNTYGDEQRCIELAKEVGREGMVVSAMGLGEDWNDQFLDEMTAVTGGHTQYINSPGAVVRFLNDYVRNLSNIFAERLQLSVAPDPDIRLEYAFKLAPSPQPLAIEGSTIPLGNLQGHRSVSVLLQLEIPAKLTPGFRSLVRIVAVGDILANKHAKCMSLNDISFEVMENPPVEETPPTILEALGKLSLYRLQERAQEALERGDIREATRRLEFLSTRLLELGESELAQQARQEAQRVAMTSQISKKGRKDLKYHTRTLILEAGMETKT